MLFSLRPEIYRPSDGITQAALILRYDQASFRERRWLPGKRGVILRFELHGPARAATRPLGSQESRSPLVPASGTCPDAASLTETSRT